MKTQAYSIMYIEARIAKERLAEVNYQLAMGAFGSRRDALNREWQQLTAQLKQLDGTWRAR